MIFYCFQLKILFSILERNNSLPLDLFHFLIIFPLLQKNIFSFMLCPEFNVAQDRIFITGVKFMAFNMFFIDTQFFNRHLRGNKDSRGICVTHLLASMPCIDYGCFR